jgi:hypothetical protein
MMSEMLFEVRRRWYCRHCSEMASLFMVDVLEGTHHEGHNQSYGDDASNAVQRVGHE